MQKDFLQKFSSLKVYSLKRFSGITKATYFTAAYRSDQDIKDTLSLADHVIKALKVITQKF